MSRPVRVVARGWGWRYAGRRNWALRGLDLVVEPGERVLLLGPSGAGKSTLLAALAGLLDPALAGETEGSLLLDGHSARDARDRSGLLLQDPETNLVMATCGDDVAFGLENRAVPAEEIWPRVDAALATIGFGYDRDRPTAALSGGEQQRVALAGILAMRPGLLLLDEPTANLDPEGAALVRAGIAAAHQATGATILIVEHRVAEALPLVDRVIVVAPGGGLIADGSPDEVFTRQGAALAAAGVWVPAPYADLPLPSRLRATPNGPAEPLLHARDVSYVHPGSERPAVRQATLNIDSREVVAIIGPNGSGKSTLAMLLAGLLRPAAGNVLATAALANHDATTPPHRWPARRLVERIGTVFQNPEHQFMTTRVRTELALGPRTLGLPESKIAVLVDDLLERLGLTRLAEANPYTLSGGEKRRLSVATALAAGPRLLVLDEPTFGQDRRTWIELVTMLAKHRDDGGAVCAVTHDEAFVDALADRVLPISEGDLQATREAVREEMA